MAEQAQAERSSAPSPPEDRSTLQLVKDIATDTATLVRKEAELAKQEILEAVTARVKAVAALAVAGVFGLFILTFLGFAAAAALNLTLSLWASYLIVAGAFVLLAGLAALFGLRRAKRPPFAPEKTKETVKEDIAWAKAQLKR